jgi:hypothetical protein
MVQLLSSTVSSTVEHVISHHLLVLVFVVIEYRMFKVLLRCHWYRLILLWLLHLLFGLSFNTFSFQRIINSYDWSINILLDNSFIVKTITQLPILLLLFKHSLSFLHFDFHLIEFCQLLGYLTLLSFLGLFLFFYRCFRSTPLGWCFH